MATNSRSVLNIGDWVKGETQEGELIIGYVESFPLIEEVVTIKVVTSDNQTTIGKNVQILTKQVKALPESKVTNREQVRFLIDLALFTGDEDWFLELSVKLKGMNELVKRVTY